MFAASSSWTSVISLVLVLACWVSETTATQLSRGQPKSAATVGFVASLKFKHRLRVCNAYPNVEKLDVYRGTEKLTTNGAMPYKSCEEFQAELKSGDRLMFKFQDASAGTFAVSDLPNNDAVLFLVIHRHDTLSTAVSFESHVFANLLNAQVAVIDTYKGHAHAAPRIRDAGGDKNKRSEDLRFGSVVAVNPGAYAVELAGTDGKVEAKNELVALNRESYIVLRVGAEAQHGKDYPEELVVYPQSDPKRLSRSSGSLASPNRVALLLFSIAFASVFGA